MIWLTHYPVYQGLGITVEFHQAGVERQKWGIFVVAGGNCLVPVNLPEGR